MTGLLYSVLYLLLLGVLCFPIGRLLARHDFRTDRPPFGCLPFEQNGKYYERFGVQKWQNRVPDISRFLPGIVPRKTVENNRSSAGLYRMIQETCIAELTHALLCLAGIALLWIWPGAGGGVLLILYVLLGNVPFMMIQRYNRPRLRRVLCVAERRERRQHENFDSQQQ